MHTCSCLPILLFTFISPSEPYFFLIWTCLQQVYFQIVSISLHLDWVVFSFSQVLYFVWKELDFKVGKKDGSLTDTYSLILARSYFWAEPVSQFYSVCLAWTMGEGEKRLRLGEQLGSSSWESVTPGITILWHIYLWHFKDIVEAMLSWRNRMVQGKRKHPSIWWPPRTSNICTWLHTNCRISKKRRRATLSSQADLSKA